MPKPGKEHRFRAYLGAIDVSGKAGPSHDLGALRGCGEQRRRYRAPHGLLTFKVLMADRVNPVRVLSDDGAVMNVPSNPPADWSGSNQSYCLCSHAGYLGGARPGRPVLPDRP